MSCDQHILDNVASTAYVDCAITVVSGTLQTEIDNSPGAWEVLGSASLTNLTKTSTITISNLPARDVLKVFVYNSNFEASVIGVRWAMGLNSDFNSANYIGGGKGLDAMTLRSDRDQSNGIEYTIYNVSGDKKIVRATGHSFDSLGNQSTTTGDVTDVWNTTAGQISSIGFEFNHTTSFTSAEGETCEVKVLGMNL